MFYPATFGLLVLILVFAYFNHFPRSSLSIIRGPTSPSFIFGHLLALLQRPVGETEFAWQDLYGNVVRFKGIFGEDRLWVADPKVLHKMLNASGYTYVSPPNYRALLTLVMGKGVFSAQGEDHRRHRNVMAPGFGQKETNDLLPVFKESAESLSMKWLEIVQSGDGQSTVDVVAWLSRGTLDAIGQAAFDIKFGSLDDDSHYLAKKYKNFFGEAFGLPSAREIFVQAASVYLPMCVLDWIADHGGHPRLVRARDLRNAATNVAKRIIEEKANALVRGTQNRDVLSLLVKANMDASAKNKLSDEELFAQMTSILIAGHETTANSLSWFLLELARNPGIQSKLRDEIRQTDTRIRGRDDPHLGVNDLGSMPYLNAFIKEGLRVHPVAPHIHRIASQDDVLPFSKPVLTRSGEFINEMPVRKGTQIFISVAAFNRDKDIWGKDAHEFNPDRWLNGSVDQKKAAGVGVYSNLMTFFSGAKACPGWRFAIIELQTFLFEIVDKFEFGLSEKAKRVVRQPMVLMTSSVAGELERGVQIPLTISLAPRDAD